MGLVSERLENMDIYIYGHGFEPTGFNVMSQTTMVPPGMTLHLYTPTSSSTSDTYSCAIIEGYYDNLDTYLPGSSAPNLLLGTNTKIRTLSDGMFTKSLKKRNGQAQLLGIANSKYALVPLNLILDKIGENVQTPFDVHWTVCRGVLSGGVHMQYQRPNHPPVPKPQPERAPIAVANKINDGDFRLCPSASYPLEKITKLGET